MTFEEAWEVARVAPVRHPDMQKGWTMRVDKDNQHWFVNPVTGSMLQFQFAAEDKSRKDWKVV